MTGRGRGMRSCKECGAPSQRALRAHCDPNRKTTDHVDKYASAHEPGGLPQWGGMDGEIGGGLGGEFPPLPSGF